MKHRAWSSVQASKMVLPSVRWMCLGSCLLISGGAWAQAEDAAAGAAPKRVVSIVPRVSLQGEWTQNARLQAGSGGGSDFVAIVNPGITVTADGERLKGQVDYSLRRYTYTREGSLDRTQNNLNAAGSYEAIEGFAFLNFSGNISQQNISAFGPRVDSGSAYNPNRTEVATYSVSPYIRGQMGAWANYMLRYNRLMSRTKDRTAFNYDMNDWAATLSGTSAQRWVNWSAELTRQSVDYANGRSYSADRIRIPLTMPVTPQFNVAVIPGWESNNYASVDKESASTLGARVDWAASDRTNVSALVEKRFFGRAHRFSFEHRTPRTAWRASDSRDANATPNQVGRVSLGPIYDLLFLQFASIEPDPVRRDLLVRAYLRANGMDPNTNVDLGFLSSGVSLDRRQDLSFTLLGQRDTVTLLASRTESSRLLQVPAGVAGDLANSSFVRSNGFSVLYTRRLTPESSLSLLGSHIKSKGQLGLNSNLLSFDANLTTRWGRHTSTSIGLRRSTSDSGGSSYTDSAVRGGVTVQY